MFNIETKKIIKGDFILEPIKINLEPGLIYHLTGKNGSGKSTLLNYIFEYYKTNISTNIIYCPDSYLGYKNITVNEIEKIYKLSAETWDSNLFNELYQKFVGLKKSKYIMTMSTGERIKMLICILLSFKPKFIIFDEALYSLDIQSKNDILTYIKSYLLENDAYFIGVSHDIELDQFSDVVIEMDEVIKSV